MPKPLRLEIPYSLYHDKGFYVQYDSNIIEFKHAQYIPDVIEINNDKIATIQLKTNYGKVLAEFKDIPITISGNTYWKYSAVSILDNAIYDKILERITNDHHPEYEFYEKLTGNGRKTSLDIGNRTYMIALSRHNDHIINWTLSLSHGSEIDCGRLEAGLPIDGKLVWNYDEVIQEINEAASEKSAQLDKAIQRRKEKQKAAAGDKITIHNLVVEALSEEGIDSKFHNNKALNGYIAVSNCRYTSLYIIFNKSSIELRQGGINRGRRLVLKKSIEDPGSIEDLIAIIKHMTTNYNAIEDSISR